MMNLVNETENIKKNNFSMVFSCILGFVLLFAALFFTVVSTFGFYKGWGWFIDFPTLIYTLGIFFAIMLTTGNMQGLLKGFGTAFSTKPYEADECTAVRNALKTALIAMPLAGMLNFVIGALGALTYPLTDNADMTKYGYGFAVALISILYAGIFEMILLIITGRVQRKAV